MATKMEEKNLYFYKGTAFPIVYIGLPVKKIMEQAHIMIVKFLKKNISLKEQVEMYKYQLDYIERLMVKYANPTTDKGMKKVASIMEKDLDWIGSVWSINVCALLKLNEIKNDDMNGILSTKVQSLSEKGLTPSSK